MDIQLTQILFQLINFAVVVGALTYLLYKPVLKIFEERASKIAEGQKAAQEAIENNKNLEKIKNKMESDLKKERAKVLTQAQEEAKKKASDILATARANAKKDHEKLLKGWEVEKAQLLKNAKAEMTDAVIAVSAKVIGETLNTKVQEKLIDTELSSILKNI